MIPTSGRIQSTAIETMSKMLQSFTLSYPDSKFKGPKMIVLLTNFSRHEGITDDGGVSYDSEDEEEKKNGGGGGDGVGRAVKTEGG